MYTSVRHRLIPTLKISLTGSETKTAIEENHQESRRFLTDFTQPGMQDIIVANVVAVAKCGIFDGVFFDWFGEDGEVLVDEHPPYEGFYSLEEEQRAKDTILQRIREAVRDDFLIIINTGRSKIPRRAWGINGTFMETRVYPTISGDLNVDPNEEPYTREKIQRN